MVMQTNRRANGNDRSWTTSPTTNHFRQQCNTSYFEFYRKFCTRYLIQRSGSQYLSTSVNKFGVSFLKLRKEICLLVPRISIFLSLNFLIKGGASIGSYLGLQTTKLPEGTAVVCRVLQKVSNPSQRRTSGT